MRSFNSRREPEGNSSGGSHGRSRWQSAEILRYSMPSLRSEVPPTQYAVWSGRTPVKVACGRSELCAARVLQNHRGTLLANHDRGGVGVAAGDLRHDRGVGDAQAGNTVDPEARIDNGVDFAPHPAGADRVQVGDTAQADLLDELVVALHGGPRDHLFDNEGL